MWCSSDLVQCLAHTRTPKRPPFVMAFSTHTWVYSERPSLLCQHHLLRWFFFPLIELSLPGDLGYSRLIVGSSFLSVAVISIVTKAAWRSMGYYQLAGQSLPSRGSQGRTSRQQHETGTTEEKCCFLACSPCFLVKPRVQLSSKGVVHCGPGPPSLISN